MLYAPCNHSVTHYSDTVCVGDHNRAVQETGLLHPCSAGHLAVAVQGEPSGEDGIFGILAARQDGSHAGTHGADTYFQRPVAGNQGCMADLHSLHVCDGVQRARRTVKRDAQIARPRFGLGGTGNEQPNNNRKYKQHRLRLCHLSSHERPGAV